VSTHVNNHQGTSLSVCQLVIQSFCPFVSWSIKRKQRSGGKTFWLFTQHGCFNKIVHFSPALWVCVCIGLCVFVCVCVCFGPDSIFVDFPENSTFSTTPAFPRRCLWVLGLLNLFASLLVAAIFDRIESESESHEILLAGRIP